MGYGGAINGGTSGGGTTTINPDGSVTTDHQGGGTTQTTIYSDGTKVVTNKQPDGSTTETVYRTDRSIEITSVNSAGFRTVVRKDKDGTEQTSVADRNGNVIGGSLRTSDGSYESFYVNEDGETIRSRVKDGFFTRIVECEWGIKFISKESIDGRVRETQQYSEDGTLIYNEVNWRRDFGRHEWVITSVRDGVTYQNRRDSDLTTDLFNGLRYAITTTESVVENGVSREISRNTFYIDVDYNRRPTSELGSVERFSRWIKEGALDVWNGLAEDSNEGEIKNGITEVTSGSEKLSSAITVVPTETTGCPGAVLLPRGLDTTL